MIQRYKLCTKSGSCALKRFSAIGPAPAVVHLKDKAIPYATVEETRCGLSSGSFCEYQGCEVIIADTQEEEFETILEML